MGRKWPLGAFVVLPIIIGLGPVVGTSNALALGFLAGIFDGFWWKPSLWRKK